MKWDWQHWKKEDKETDYRYKMLNGLEEISREKRATSERRKGNWIFKRTSKNIKK